MQAATLLSVVAVGAVAVLHTAIAAVGARFFRLRLSTRWGAALYTLLLVPATYVVTTLAALGALGIGGGLTIGRDTLVLFLLVGPFALGYALELFWFPPPEELEPID